MNNSPLSVLPLLADGDFHSGERLGEALGVSRAAVWKHLQKLSDLGLTVESVRGKGYRLAGGLELLDALLIRQGLSEAAVVCVEALDVFEQLASTNVAAADYSLGSSSRGYVCLAEHQLRGRGRRGRQWVSPYGCNIYLSIAWQFEGAAQLEGLSLAVGAVIAQTLKQLGVAEVQLKWPNDILLNGKKLGGVLLEMSGDPSDICKVVVGVGLNVRMPENMHIDQPWVALSQQLPNVSRNHLASKLIDDLLEMLSDFSTKSFRAYRDCWQSFDAYKGCPVRVSSGQRILEGVAEGVSDNGALCLRVDGVIQQVHGGEVSLRPMYAS